MNYPIIDSHFHIWDTKALRYPWLDNRPALNRPFLFQDYVRAMEGLPLEGAVYVEVTSEDYVREVEWVTEQAEENPLIKGIVSWCALEDRQSIRAVLENMQHNPLIRGVRRMLKKAPDPKLCLSTAFIEGIRLLPQYGLVYDMAILPAHLQDVYTMMRQCEDVKIVLEHSAEPDIKGDGFETWARDLARISELPNAYCKLSGFLTKADPKTWKTETLRPYMEFVVEKFGFDRVMFGSDWPPVTQIASLRKWIDIIQEVYVGESSENMCKLFSGTAKGFFNI